MFEPPCASVALVLEYDTTATCEHAAGSVVTALMPCTTTTRTDELESTGEYDTVQVGAATVIVQ